MRDGGGPGRARRRRQANGFQGAGSAHGAADFRSTNSAREVGCPRAVRALLSLACGAALAAAPTGGLHGLLAAAPAGTHFDAVAGQQRAPTTAPVAAAGPPSDDTQPLTASSGYEWHLPRGFPTPAVPADNSMSSAKVELGQRLFFEPRLSVSGKHSCATCHEPARAYSDGRALAIGATGEPLPRSAMSLVNVAYNISYGWTRPELQSLETQMLDPLLNEHPVELGLAGRQASVCGLLVADPAYRTAFAQAFPRDPVPVSFENLIKAIAAFERTLVFGGSPFDRYVFGGDHAALSEQAKRGMQIFYSHEAGCGSCHSGFNFNGNWRDSQGDTGKPGFANNGVGDQLMRVPSLRNIALTAPYMHDGRFATLDAVLDHYARVAQMPTSDARLRTFKLSAHERADLIAFLNTLTDAQFSGR